MALFNWRILFFDSSYKWFFINCPWQGVHFKSPVVLLFRTLCVLNCPLGRKEQFLLRNCSLRITNYLSFSLSSKAALTTTNTEPKLCHSAPVTGVRTPKAERSTAERLMISEAAMFVFTFIITLRTSANRYELITLYTCDQWSQVFMSCYNI